jgi:hypothetical protein
MSLSLSKSYRYARLGLVKNTTLCLLWIVAGMGFLFVPIGHFRWLGLLFVGYGFFLWIFTLSPRWKHVVILDEAKLVIGKQSYDWDQFDLMQIGKSGSTRIIQLIGQKGKLNLEIKDDLPGFDELAKDCFFHMNRQVKKTRP